MERKSLYRDLAAPRPVRRTPETRKKEEGIGPALDRLLGWRPARNLYRELSSSAEHSALRARTPLTKRKELVSPTPGVLFGRGKVALPSENRGVDVDEPVVGVRRAGRTDITR